MRSHTGQWQGDSKGAGHPVGSEVTPWGDLPEMGVTGSFSCFLSQFHVLPTTSPPPVGVAGGIHGAADIWRVSCRPLFGCDWRGASFGCNGADEGHRESAGTEEEEEGHWGWVRGSTGPQNPAQSVTAPSLQGLVWREAQ